jgi:hypothetical protein
MNEEMRATASDGRPAESGREEDEITHPIRTICSRAGDLRNTRAQLLKKKGDSAPRTPDWTEIGDPAA